MEHKFYTDNFERLLKEQSDEFRMYPSKRVWHSIYNDLHPDRKWPSIAVSLVLVTTLFLIGYWNNNAGSATAVNTKKAIPAESIAGNKSTGNSFQPTGTANPSPGTSKSSQTDLAKETTNGRQNTTASLNSKIRQYAASGVNPLTATAKHQPAAEDTKNTAAAIPGNNSTESRSAGTAAGSLAGNVSTTPAAVTSANAKITGSTVTAGLQNNTTLTAATGSNPAITTPAEAVTGAAATEEETLSSLNTAIAPLNNAADPVVEKTAKTDLINSNDLKVPAAVKKTLAAAKQLSAEDKSWVEHYSFYNKSSRKRWKGRLSSEIFLTPGAGLRKMVSNTDFAPVAAPSSVVNISPALPGTAIAYKPGITFEVGAGLSYAVAKNVRIKAGIQANFTNYSVGVTDINHPVLTTLMLNNVNSGYPYLESRVSSLANIPGLNNKRAHNQTSQISLPVGMAVKLTGNQKMEWYIASTIQPTYVFGGKAYLPSADHNNFIADASLIRKWNINAAAETYIQYKMDGFTLQAGPEFRRQLISTYSQKYTYNEKLYNIGVKIGLVKNF